MESHVERKLKVEAAIDGITLATNQEHLAAPSGNDGTVASAINRGSLKLAGTSQEKVCSASLHDGRGRPSLTAGRRRKTGQRLGSGKSDQCSQHGRKRPHQETCNPSRRSVPSRDEARVHMRPTR
jgi:hypothetical protein